MSFHFSFTARSDYSARQQLHQVTAPAAVKALVEQALAAIKWPEPKPPERVNVAGHSLAGEVRSTAQRPAEVETFGVMVEAWGHIADSGGGISEIQRFIVRPLVDGRSS